MPTDETAGPDEWTLPPMPVFRPLGLGSMTRMQPLPLPEATQDPVAEPRQPEPLMPAQHHPPAPTGGNGVAPAPPPDPSRRTDHAPHHRDAGRRRERAATGRAETVRHRRAAPEDKALPMRGKVMVVGASSRAGAAVARELAALGYRLALHEDAAPSAALPGLPGGPHLTVTADITDSREVEALFADVHTAFGPVDTVIVALDAGDEPDPALGGTAGQWADTWISRLSTHVLAAATVAHAAVRGFAGRRGGGRLILIDPAGGGRSPLDRAVSGALRGLVDGLTADPAAQRCGVMVVDAADSSAEELAASVGWLVSAPAGLAGSVTVSR